MICENIFTAPPRSHGCRWCFQSTCLFTRLDRVYPGPSRVSDSPVSAENIIYEDFVLMGELRWSFSALLQWRKKSGKKSIFHPFSFVILPLSFREALNRSTTQFPQSKQRLPKLRFLQKLGCQKPCWDQARLCLAW